MKRYTTSMYAIFAHLGEDGPGCVSTFFPSRRKAGRYLYSMNYRNPTEIDFTKSDLRDNAHPKIVEKRKHGPRFPRRLRHRAPNGWVGEFSITELYEIRKESVF